MTKGTKKENMGQRPDAALITARSAVIGALQAIQEGDTHLFLERVADLRRSKEDVTVIASPEERDRIAFRLRVVGAPLDEIAAVLQYATNADASAAVRRERHRIENLTVTETEETIALEVARLDLWLRAIQPAALSGDVEAVRTCLLVSKRRAELLGLDQPTKHALGYITPQGKLISQLVLEQPDGDASPAALPTGEEDAETDS